jgi:hypothetical protein
MPHAFFVAPQYGFLVQQMSPALTSAPTGTPVALMPGLPSSTRPWAEPRTGRCRTPSLWCPSMTFQCSRWDPQSLASCLSSMMLAPPMPMTDWVADSGITNQTTPHLGLLRLPTLPPTLSVLVLSYP